ncbi:LysM peptidoglycan-binding domain-containing protein [Salinicoccus sp. YB14-2]|uniref:LysM peptidoglycan-binding domain-containing protein n=1 Tax=Salinicoccus sp. YB14-2 TaxID=1572701 RepID=UPI000689AEC0|nr:LysM peptidoglycan-binding domain-containing protein [Salinicoccus sp. YB14-2]
MKKLLSVGTAVAFSTVLAANAEASEKDHKVESGETLSEIAALNETTVSALKEANDLSSDLILPGQVLQVTGEVSEEEKDGVYVIQSGDTLFEIAVEFDLTVKELMDLNNLSSDLIVAGNELIVSKDAVSEEVQVAAPQVVEEPVVQEEEVVEEQPVQQQQTEQEQNSNEQAAAEQAAAEEAAAQEAAEQAAAQEAAQQEQQQQEVQTQNQSAAPSSNSGLNWGALAACESGGNPSIVSSNGKYHGLYQFDARTWQSVGGSGVASQASAAEQTQRAQQLYDSRGSQPWPVCGSRL